MRPKQKDVKPRRGDVIKRWSVVAVFDDGTRAVIRDFHLYTDACRCMNRLATANLYVNRTYKLTIMEIAYVNPGC